MKGSITITVQREERLKAIADICAAIKEVAKALNSSPQVNITGNVITTPENSTGIRIEPMDDVDRTDIIETGDG